jgi:predicted double-glycine peptidase
MPRLTRIVSFAAVVCVLAGNARAIAQPLSLRVAGQRLSKRVKSLKEIKQEGVILQKLDFSCGAAALATLLSFHFRDAVQEAQVIGFIFIHGQTPAEGLKKYIRRRGFSLLDLKRFAAFRGYKVAGYKGMDLKDLLEFLVIERTPVLVPIVPLGYSHFVVLRGIRQGRVLLADPAYGNTTMSIGRFAEVWVDGIGLIVSKREIARASSGTVPRDLQASPAVWSPTWLLPSAMTLPC